jgi:hypothetical protein
MCPACKRNDQLLESQRGQAESQRDIARQQMEEQRDIARQQMEDQRDIADQQIEEQREIARQQVEEQRDIAQEAHLNAFKLRFVDVAIQAASEPEKAAAAALFMMRSTTFSENIHWFWGDVFRSKFLHDLYFNEALAPLLKGGDAIDYLDTFDPQVIADSESWLQWSSNDSDWNRVALPKIRHYKKVLQQRKDEDRQRLEDYQAQQAILAEDNHRSNLRKSRRVWLLSSVITLIYGAIYFIMGWRGYQGHLMSVAAGNGLGPGSGLIALATAGGIFLVILLLTLRKIHEWAADSIQHGSRAGHFTGIVWLSIAASAGLVFNYWSLANDTRIHVAMLASVIILPMIPLIRELLALALVSIIVGLFAIITAFFSGVATGYLADWISRDHPVATIAKLEEKTKVSNSPRVQHAQKLGRPAMIDDQDGWSNLRKTPSGDSPIIRKILQDELFCVIEANGDWCRVITDAGEEGWMHQSIVKFTSPP